MHSTYFCFILANLRKKNNGKNAKRENKLNRSELSVREISFSTNVVGPPPSPGMSTTCRVVVKSEKNAGLGSVTSRIHREDQCHYWKECLCEFWRGQLEEKISAHAPQSRRQNVMISRSCVWLSGEDPHELDSAKRTRDKLDRKTFVNQDSAPERPDNFELH